MDSSRDNNFIEEFFQDLYNKISKKGLCGIKGSFVIQDNNGFFFDKLKKLQNELNKLRKRKRKGEGAELKTLPWFLKSHTKFLNNKLYEMYEIDMSHKPFNFECQSKNFCYKMVSKNIKFYQFTVNEDKYLYLKFETAPTRSWAHLKNAYAKYYQEKSRLDGLENCLDDNISDSESDNISDSESENDFFFYHAENAGINDAQQQKIVDIFGLNFRDYKKEKNKYTPHCTSNESSVIASNESSGNCILGNEIYIPEKYIKEYIDEKSKKTPGGTRKRKRKRKITRKKNNKKKKSRKKR